MGTCVRDALGHMHTDSCTQQIPIPDQPRYVTSMCPTPRPQLFLSSDRSPLIPEAKTASLTWAKRKDSRTFIFHFKEPSIHCAKTFTWADAFAEENWWEAYLISSTLVPTAWRPKSTCLPCVTPRPLHQVGLFHSYGSFGSAILRPYSDPRGRPGRRGPCFAEASSHSSFSASFPSCPGLAGGSELSATLQLAA